MTWPGVFDPGQGCSWCGHAWPHPQPCPGHITVGRGKDQRRVDCPCARNETNKEKS